MRGYVDRMDNYVDDTVALAQCVTVQDSAGQCVLVLHLGPLVPVLHLGPLVPVVHLGPLVPVVHLGPLVPVVHLGHVGL